MILHKLLINPLQFSTCHGGACFFRANYLIICLRAGATLVNLFFNQLPDMFFIIPLSGIKMCFSINCTRGFIIPPRCFPPPILPYRPPWSSLSVQGVPKKLFLMSWGCHKICMFFHFHKLEWFIWHKKTH